MVTCMGEVYDSLSTSGGVARKFVEPTLKGQKVAPTTGWRFWMIQDSESGDMVEVDI